MEGKVLKEKLRKTGCSFAEISRRLNVNPQALTSIFNGLDVKSGTIEKISNVLNVPISYFYDNYNGGLADDVSPKGIINPELLSFTPEKGKMLYQQIDFLNKRIEQMEALLREKDRVISLYDIMLKDRFKI